MTWHNQLRSLMSPTNRCQWCQYVSNVSEWPDSARLSKAVGHRYSPVW